MLPGTSLLLPLRHIGGTWHWDSRRPRNGVFEELPKEVQLKEVLKEMSNGVRVVVLEEVLLEEFKETTNEVEL